MFPNLVKISDLHQHTIKTGPGYIVGNIKTPIDRLTSEGEWAGKFEGVNALFDYQRQFQPKPKQEGASDRSKNSGSREGFYFFNRFAEAIDVYTNTPGQITKFRQNDLIIDGGDSSGKEIMYDVTGDILDVGRFLSGEPEVFGSLTNGNPRNKRVTVQIALSWWYGVDQVVINERSKRLIRLVDWLESQNIRTQLVGIDSNECIDLELIIKQFDEPLSLTDLAVVSHSDFLRRVLFRLTEYSPTYMDGYGRPQRLGEYWSKNLASYASEYNDEYTVLVDGGMTESKPKVTKDFDKLEVDLLQALSDDEPSKVFNVLF